MCGRSRRAARSSPRAPGPRRARRPGAASCEIQRIGQIAPGNALGQLELVTWAAAWTPARYAGDHARTGRSFVQARGGRPRTSWTESRTPDAASRRTETRRIRAGAPRAGSAEARSGGHGVSAQEVFGLQRARPGRCTRKSRSAPRPQAIVSAASSTVPGAPSPCAGAAASTFSAPPPRPVKVPGHGLSARTGGRSGGLPRPVDPAVLARQLRRVGHARFRLGAGRGVSSSARRIRPRPARRAHDAVSRLSWWGDREQLRSSIGPVSSPASICMMVMPVARRRPGSRPGSAPRRASAAAGSREC